MERGKCLLRLPCKEWYGILSTVLLAVFEWLVRTCGHMLKPQLKTSFSEYHMSIHACIPDHSHLYVCIWSNLGRCGLVLFWADGRNHSKCCASRQIPNRCLSLCSGIVPAPVDLTCLPHVAEIVDCMEMGHGKCLSRRNRVCVFISDHAFSMSF